MQKGLQKSTSPKEDGQGRKEEKKQRQNQGPRGKQTAKW
jgi:hypothetical protein